MGRPTLAALFVAFLLLGCVAFGGPAMVPHVRRLVITRMRWLDEANFLRGVALCQALPGATVMQIAGYCGFQVRGVPGAMATGIGFGLPAFTFMMVLSALYERAHALPAVVSILDGLRAVIVAVIAEAFLAFARVSIKDWRHGFIAVACAGLFAAGVGPLLIVLLAALSGLGLIRSGPGAPTAGAGNGPGRTGRALGVLIVSLLGVLACLYLVRRDLFDLALLMTKIDLLAFGGGFASISLMFQEFVRIRGWMDPGTFLDGIVLGQFTPGPIVITATFVGYLTHGFFGGVVASVGVFLPTLLVLMGIAPVYERLNRSAHFRRCVGGVLCLFVGLLLTVTVNFALNVRWDLPHVALSGAALAALLLRVEILWVVLAGTVASALML